MLLSPGYFNKQSKIKDPSNKKLIKQTNKILPQPNLLKPRLNFTVVNKNPGVFSS